MSLTPLSEDISRLLSQSLDTALDGGMDSPPLVPRPELAAPGSSERCAARWVMADAAGRPWLVERLRPGQEGRRKALARVLDGLSRAGLDQAVAWQPLGGEFLLEAGPGMYQVSRYMLHEPLPRPAFLDQEERGQALAEFLDHLRAASLSLPADLTDRLDRLDLPGYARDLALAVQRRRPDVVPDIATRLDRVLDALNPLFEAWSGLPLALCHGDYHPLNVLWQGTEVLAVIDWEFCGPKPELYDLANLVGCCGFEHPRAFVSGLVPALLKSLVRSGFLTPDNVQWLPPLVLGLRLAWLSEWLRRKDEDMLDQELTYLDLLVSALPDMSRAWALA